MSAPIIDPADALLLLDLTPSQLDRLLRRAGGMPQWIAGDRVGDVPPDLRTPYNRAEWVDLEPETRAATIALGLAARDGLRPRKVRR